jgi:hypothetical protein
MPGSWDDKHIQPCRAAGWDGNFLPGLALVILWISASQVARIINMSHHTRLFLWIHSCVSLPYFSMLLKFFFLLSPYGPGVAFISQWLQADQRLVGVFSLWGELLPWLSLFGLGKRHLENRERSVTMGCTPAFVFKPWVSALKKKIFIKIKFIDLKMYKGQSLFLWSQDKCTLSTKSRRACLFLSCPSALNNFQIPWKP